MKRSLLMQTLALFAVVALGGTVLSQDKGKDKKPEGDKPLDLAAYAKYAEPGPQHKLLEPLAGSWTYKVKIWFDPSKPPMESTGTLERKWVLGGRFLQENFKGDEKEHPFAGLGIVGYDNAQKKFTGVWMDSHSTSIMTSTGTADASGKAFTFTGDNFDPVMGKNVKSRDVLTIDGPDKQHMEMYRLMPDGKETKMLDLQFTRAKK